MTIFFKIFGEAWPLWPPLATPMTWFCLFVFSCCGPQNCHVDRTAASLGHISYLVHIKHEQPQVHSPDSHVSTDMIHQTQDADNVLWV